MNTPSKPKYDVGYGKPPEHSQWKKGQCGNPKRRRKRQPKPVATIIEEFFAREIVLVEDGISERRSAFEIICLQLCNKAMTGKTRALNVLKKYADFAASRDPTGGLRAVLIEDETNPKQAGKENG
jgi:hypothetical protein